MEVSTKTYKIIIIICVSIILLSLFAFFSPIQPNILFLLGKSDSILCGGNGYHGRVISDNKLGKLECCGIAEYCTSDPCSLDGRYVCR